MSDSPQNRPPQGSGTRGPNEPPGFNWRLAILLGAAFLILGLAFFSSGVGPAAQPMNFSEFRKAWEQGRVITGDTKHALSVTTGDSPYNMEVTGYLDPSTRLVPGEEAGTSKNVSATIRTEELADLLGDSVVFNVIREEVVEAPSDTIMLSKSGVRRLAALGWLKPAAGKSAITVHSMDGNVGLISAIREIPTEGVVAHDAPRTGQPKAFKVITPVLIQGDELGKVLSEGLNYKPNNDFLRSAIFTFLPVLLIVLLLFFLFRQQMWDPLESTCRHASLSIL